MHRVRATLLSTLALVSGACSSAPVAPVPAPLPEALAWQLPGDGGAFLGLECEERMAASLEDLAFEPGLAVVSVVDNSPAAAAGMRPGDVLLAVDGRPVDEPAALARAVAQAGAGAAVVLAVERDDSLFDVELTLAGGSGGRPASVRVAARLDPARTRAAWATAPDGARLVALADDSPLHAAGLVVGDVLVAVDDQPLTSARQLLRRLTARDPGDTVRVTRRHADGDDRVLEIRLHEPDRRVLETSLPVLYAYTSSVDGERASFSLLDLWFFELFQWRRDRLEQRWVLLELFGYELIPFASGMGELQ